MSVYCFILEGWVFNSASGGFRQGETLSGVQILIGWVLECFGGKEGFGWDPACIILQKPFP